MKNTLKNIALAITGSLLITALYSCNGNESASGAKCADSSANAATSAVVTTDTNSTVNAAGTAANTNAVRENNAHGNDKMMKGGTNMTTGQSKEQSMEPTGPAILSVSSPAFGTGNVIPLKYTCDGQGATPPINVSNIPLGSRSLAMIVHDYEATPEGGFTYWLIWNLDTVNIPENFVNNHEGMNAAKQYGYTPICAKSGNHRYHFIVYALDTKLVMQKTTTKQGLESVMRGHILGKGEVVGIYNKHLE